MELTVVRRLGYISCTGIVFVQQDDYVDQSSGFNVILDIPEKNAIMVCENTTSRARRSHKDAQLRLNHYLNRFSHYLYSIPLHDYLCHSFP